MKRAIDVAIEACGSQKALADALGVKPVQVHKWSRPDGQVPAARCIAIENHTGVTRYQLRPDVFGSEPPAIPIKSAS